MSTEVPIKVKITSGEAEAGKKRVVRSLEDIRRRSAQTSKELGRIGPTSKRSMDQASSSARLLKRALAGVVGVATLRSVVQMVDTYTNLQNRLKLVTENTVELESVTGKLFDIANETRISFEGTAEVYARTALATKEMGLTTQDTLEFTESLNKAIILSGASAQEAQAGMIQLSQGLASGALRGDELRSVLEQLPVVADIIADGLGVTRGELREMGKDGKITADIVIDSFKKAKVELDQNFGQTVPTIGQSFTVLKNQVMEFTAEIDKTYQISSNVAEALLYLGDNVENIAKIVGTAAAAWGTYRLAILAATGASVLAGIAGSVTAFISLATTVRNLSGAVALLNAAFMVGPLALVAGLAAVAGGVAYWISQSDDATVSNKSLRSEITKLAKETGDADNAMRSLARSTEKVALLNEFDVIFDDIQKTRQQLELWSKVQSIDNSARMAENKAKLKQLSAEKDRVYDLIVNYDELKKVKEFKPSYNPANDNEKIKEQEKMRLEMMNQELDLYNSINAPLAEYNSQMEILKRLKSGENEAGIKLGEDDFQTAKDEIDIDYLKNAVPDNFGEGFINQLRLMKLETKNSIAEMGTDFGKLFGPGGTFVKGIGDAVAQTIVFGKSFKEQIGDLARQVLAQMISSLVQVGLNLAINAALTQLFTKVQEQGAIASIKTVEAASVTSATATAAAWSPAAAAVSLASFGANAPPAIAGMAAGYAASAGLSQLKGFSEGGYTGDIGTSTVAGVVHGEEFVVNAAATKNNRATLEAMNKGASPSANSAVTVNIINEIPDAEFQVSQTSTGEMEIIAKRAVRSEAPKVIASDLASANSQTSKALSTNYKVERKRS